MVHQNLNLLVSISYVPHRVNKHLRKNKTIQTGQKKNKAFILTSDGFDKA